MPKGEKTFRKVTQVKLNGGSGLNHEGIVLHGEELEKGRPIRVTLPLEEAARLGHRLIGYMRQFRRDLVECPHKQIWWDGHCACCHVLFPTNQRQREVLPSGLKKGMRTLWYDVLSDAQELTEGGCYAEIRYRDGYTVRRSWGPEDQSAIALQEDAG